MALNNILAAIRVLAADEALIAPDVTRQLITDFVRRLGVIPKHSPRLVEGITRREGEVLTLVGRDRSNA